MKKILLDVEEDRKMQLWSMIRSIQLFYRKTVNSQNQ